MDLKQISTILNTTVIKNELGETVTIAEDLSNIVEVGTAISNMTADTLKDFQRKLAVGIYKNYVQARLYKTKDFKILKDAVAFGGGIQRIMAKNLADAQDSHILNLVDGQDYFDGTYHGIDLSAQLYVDTKAFKVSYSIGDDTWTQSFTNAEDVSKLFGLIEARIANTIEAQLHALIKRVICKLIVDTYGDGRVIKLVTAFNSTTGGSDTYTQIKADPVKFRQFNAFTNSLITRLVDYVAEMNDKYNDGSVVTFTPKDKINVLLLTQFATEQKFMALANTYNAEMAALDVKYETVPSWQNQSNDIMPDYGVTAEVVDSNAADPVQNVVGVIFDEDSCGVTVKLDKVTSQYIGSEGYTNFYHHIAANYYTDARNSSVVLTLE